MTRTIALKDLQTKFDLAPGDDIVIESAGKEIAHIIPPSAEATPQTGERPLGLLNGRIWMSPDFDEELPEEFWCPPDDPLTK